MIWREDTKTLINELSQVARVRLPYFYPARSLNALDWDLRWTDELTVSGILVFQSFPSIYGCLMISGVFFHHYSVLWDRNQDQEDRVARLVVMQTTTPCWLMVILEESVNFWFETRSGGMQSVRHYAQRYLWRMVVISTRMSNPIERTYTLYT